VEGHFNMLMLDSTVEAPNRAATLSLSFQFYCSYPV
jgi:hypothetical protein